MKMFDIAKIKNFTMNIKSEFDSILELNSISNSAINELVHQRLEVNILNLKNHVSILEEGYKENESYLKGILNNKFHELEESTSRIKRKEIKREIDGIENGNLFKDIFMVREESRINYKSMKRVNDLLYEELKVNKKMLDKYIAQYVDAARKRNKSFSSLSEDMKNLMTTELNSVEAVSEYIAEAKKDLYLPRKIEEVRNIDIKDMGNQFVVKSKDLYSNIKSNIMEENDEVKVEENVNNIDKEDLSILEEVDNKEGHPKIIVDVLNTSLDFYKEGNKKNDIVLFKDNTVMDITVGDYKIRKKVVDGLIYFRVVKFLDDSFVPVYDSEKPGKWLNPEDFISGINLSVDNIKKDFLFEAYDFIDNI